MRRHLLLLLVALLPILASAYDAEINGIYYNFSGDEATITYCDRSKSGALVIPSAITYNGKTYSVTTIGDEAFTGCSSLTSISISSSVTDIGWSAFAGCVSLISVSLPNNLKILTGEIFSGCSSLTSINLPDSLKRIEMWAFNGCSSLTSITIPNNVTKIEILAFFECTSLTSIVIPSSMKSIDRFAFYDCSNLTDVYCYAEDVPNTDTDAFSDSDIRSATLHVSKYSINSYKSTRPWSGFGNFVGMDKYMLTYKVDGSEYRTYTLYKGQTINPEPALQKEGYTFSGWSEIPATMPAHDVIVTGSFIPNNYTLTYMINGEVYKTLSVVYGSTINQEATPQKEGYTFSGWSGLPATMPAHDVIVTGSFSINSYTLTYKVGGSVYKTFSVVYGSVITPEPSPVKKGMTFSGWSEVPLKMPARDVTITGAFSWSKTTVEGVIYQVTDTLNNYASVIGYEGDNGGAKLCSNVEIGGDIYEVNSITYNALPRNVTVYTPMGRLLFWLWENGYEDIKETGTSRNLSAPKMSILAKTASSLTLSFANQYPELTETVIVSGSPLEKKENGYEIKLTGLRPNYRYYNIASVTLTFEDLSYTKYYSFDTSSLTLTTQQPKVISAGNVIVSANSNLDDEETKVGFEWRRTDWPDDFTSNTGVAYLYEGKMEGYIRNLYTEKLWRYRPYYESDSGNRYYGEWVGIDPTNTSYFEPTVHTYAQINVTGNRAEVKGYAMRGTDNVQSQGFMYWQNNTSVSLRRRAASVPSGATVVNASGNIMTATLEDLEYEATYNYVAFVTTSEGETFYGEMQTFTTSFDPDGIEEVKSSEEATEVARYDLQGRMIAKPQKGINIIRYSDGTSKKILIK